MASRLPQYYAGMLNVGADPDWNRVAKVVDLLRANGVALVTAPAVVRDDGRAELPFFTKSGSLLELVGAAGDPRDTIGALSPYKLAAYTKIDPKQAGGLVLDAMVQLCDGDHEREPARACDLRPRANARATADPNSVFDGLVGLSRQRDLLKKIATLVAKHGRDSVECLHMAFAGGPGTGKTELARRLLAHFDALGVTSGQGTFVSVGAADLIGRYVGQTPGKTRAVVERALGGLLFIDEAYALADSTGYGQEAIDTLVELLEAHRDNLVCVAAGYPRELENLFASNPGLRDRFAFRVEFDGYSTPELARIFELFAAKRGFSVDPTSQGELRSCIEGLRRGRDFANARSVRRLFDRAIMETASRCDEKVIAACDLRAAYEQDDLGGSSVPRVGFVA